MKILVSITYEETFEVSDEDCAAFKARCSAVRFDVSGLTQRELATQAAMDLMTDAIEEYLLPRSSQAVIL